MRRKWHKPGSRRVYEIERVFPGDTDGRILSFEFKFFGLAGQGIETENGISKQYEQFIRIRAEGNDLSVEAEGRILSAVAEDEDVLVDADGVVSEDDRGESKKLNIRSCLSVGKTTD